MPLLEKNYTTSKHYEKIQSEVIRFSDEARNILTNCGYSIYTLTGLTIETLRKKGWLKMTKGHWTQLPENPEFESLRSRRSEVAFFSHSDEFYLPDSNNKTYHEQLEMTRKFKKEISRLIKDVDVVIGSAPDYIEVSQAHFIATGQLLVSRDSNSKFNFDKHMVRTTTRYNTKFGTRLLYVGFWFFDYPSNSQYQTTHCSYPYNVFKEESDYIFSYEIDINRYDHSEDAFDKLWIAPLIVPRQKKFLIFN